MTIDRNFKENNEPLFSLHSFGMIWVIIFLAVSCIGVQYILERDHDNRKQQKIIIKENIENGEK